MFWVGAFFIIVIVAIIYGAISAAKRKQALQAWCLAQGFDFQAARQDDPGERYPQVAMMHAGHHRYGNNWCTGAWPTRQAQGQPARPLCCFDYHYTTGSGKNQTTHALSILVIDNARPLKPLSIRPEGLLDKVGEFFGTQEIHFESGEFNRRFHVTCADRKWAYAVLPPRALELLLAAPRKVHIQFDLCSMVLWDGRIWPVQAFEDAASVACGLLDLMPQFAATEGEP